MIDELLGQMIESGVTISVVVVFLWWQTKRLSDIEDRLVSQLDECWRRLCEHLDRE